VGDYLESVPEKKEEMSRRRIGLIVNPVAGIGGRVGLKGSDGEEIYKRAMELGALPVSPGRTRETLRILAEIKDDIELFTYPNGMGEEEASACGFSPLVIGSISPGATTPKDTERAAGEMRDRGVELLLFTGGDGTARNVFDAVSDMLPVLGIPGGVKIHSGVYAASPQKAARLVVDFVRMPQKTSLRSAEVMDIDEEMVRRDRVSARLYGYMKVPYERGLNQSSKAGSNPREGVHQDEIASDVIYNMEKDTIYLVAPGTTTKAVTDKLGLKGTLLGIDAVENHRIIASDLNEAAILDMMDRRSGGRFKIIITIIGQQGYLFGRGNQQLSPTVVRKVGKQNIIVIATTDKILSLSGEPFLVDTGDPSLDKDLEGYTQVVTGFGKRQVYRISA
jgi:predicted polyphosphate/ATP-dependent NAD kinase